MRTFCRATIVATFCAAVCGCGDPSYLSGVVTVDGQPLADATVVLYPQHPNATLVVGVTDGAGRFDVTPAVGPGITPGKYKVTVSKRQPKSKPKLKSSKASPPPPDEFFPGAAAGPDMLELPPETIPPRYSDLGLTILEIDSPPEDEIRLELTSR